MGFLFVSVACIGVGIAVSACRYKLPDGLRALAAMIALMGVLILLMVPSMYDSAIINNADAAMAKFEAGEINITVQYENAMATIDKYNKKVLEAESRAGNWWDGRLLRKFDGRSLLELPEEFYAEYADLLKHRMELE